MKTRRIPPQLTPYFWDVNTKSLSIHDNSEFIIERLVEKGDFSAVKWVIESYGKQNFLSVIMTSSNISHSTKNLWLTVYNE